MPQASLKMPLLFSFYKLSLACLNGPKAPIIHIKVVAAEVANISQIHNASKLMSACFCPSKEQFRASSSRVPKFATFHSHPPPTSFWKAEFLFVCLSSVLPYFGGIETRMFQIFFTYFISFKLMLFLKEKTKIWRELIHPKHSKDRTEIQARQILNLMAFPPGCAAFFSFRKSEVQTRTNQPSVRAEIQTQVSNPQPEF